jgi:hypothetical protein
MGRKDPATRSLFGQARQAISVVSWAAAPSFGPFHPGLNKILFSFFLGYYKFDSNFENS